MQMRDLDVWTYGWLYGYIGAKCGLDHSEAELATAMRDPLAGFALIHRRAIVQHREITDDPKVKRAVDAISGIGGDAVTDAQQGVWILGFYAGEGGKDYIPSNFSIAQFREAKNLTQAGLADKLGVEQSTVARWESGAAKPSKENLQKLVDILW